MVNRPMNRYKTYSSNSLKKNIYEYVTFQRVTFEPSMDFKQNHWKLKILQKLGKAATFISFLHLSHKNTILFFL